MTPNTQSVCKHCGALANSPFHDESDPEGHKFEPVAEPASTGEPPEKFKVCCADAEITVTDEKVQVSCPHGSASFYLAARTPQVEEASRKIVEYFVKQYGDLGVVLNRPDIDAVESILEHGVGAPAQPGPLLPENVRELLERFRELDAVRLSPSAAEQEEMDETLAELLDAPAPAQGTPEPPKVEELAWQFIAHVFPSMEREQARRYIKEGATILRPYVASPLAIPASTARTDGWVSMEERMPQPSDDVYYEVWTCGEDHSFAYYNPEGARKENVKPGWDWYDRMENAWYHNERYTHWKPITAAPGSVPPAPTKPEDVPDLYRLAYMPGVWRCPKCGFVLSKATISMSSGSIGTTPEDRQSEQCPNDREWMVPVTYKESLKECQDRLLAELGKQQTPAAEIVDHLIWTLDIMKMYEGRLIQFGDSPDLVYSDVHKKRVAEARQSIQDAAKYVEFRVPNIETRNPKE